MIRQVTPDSFEDIEGLFRDLIEKRRRTNSPIPDSFVEEARELLSNGRAMILAAFRSSRPLGFVMVDRDSHRIGPFHADESTGSAAQTKRRLFDEAFQKLSETERLVRTGGPSIDATLSKYVVKRGFKRFDRKEMKLPGAAIELLPELSLPDGFAFASYSSEKRIALAQLIHTANAGHSEAELYPEYFASEEGALRLLDQLEELKTHPDYSKIVTCGEDIVGACLIVAASDRHRHVAELCIHKRCRRRGLAKNLLTYTLKELKRTAVELECVTLDVTEDNPARLLYETLGFEGTSDYTTFTWTRKAGH